MNESKNRKLDFSDVKLYAVTPEPKDPRVLLEKIEGLLKGGVDAVQLRSRTLPDRELVSLGKAVKKLCAQYEAHFLVNNRSDIALALDADGLHIGHEDLPLPFVRNLVGHRKIIGISTHSMPEAIEAQKLGADYVSCGPLWATPTKPNYKAVGLGLIGFYKATLRIPFVAIGGIDQSNIDEVIAAGAKTIAVVRAFFDSANPEKMAKEFKEKLEGKVWI